MPLSRGFLPLFIVLAAVPALPPMAAAEKFDINGRIYGLGQDHRASVRVDGPGVDRTVPTAEDGTYHVRSVGPGTYQVTPVHTGYLFTPEQRSVTVQKRDVSGVNFTAHKEAPEKFEISGHVAGLGAGHHASIRVSGKIVHTVSTHDDGTFRFAGLPPDSYTIRPACQGYHFSPTFRTVAVTDQDRHNIGFTARENAKK
jgi:hypothetical protein